LTSFANRSRGKSLRSIKCSINPTPIYHPCHTAKSLSTSHHHLHHNTTFPTITSAAKSIHPTTTTPAIF
jgi:hypothetical protein